MVAAFSLAVAAATLCVGGVDAYAPSSLLRAVGNARCDAVVMAGAITCVPRKLPKSAVALDITVPKDLSSEIHKNVIGELSKTASIPGFRKGKVPPQAVVSALGEKKIKHATIEQIIDVGMQQGGAQVQLHTVGEARLEEEIEDLEDRYKIGEEISFSVVVDVYPQVPLTEAEYTGLSVSVEDIPFNQEAYDKALLKLRDQHADLTDAEDGAAAQMDEQLTINMNGYFKTADGGKGEALPQVAGGDGISVRLQEGKFMYGLVEGLVGATKGEKKEITVTFPARQSAPQLAGKDAIFEVEVLNIQRRQLAEPGDEFAAKVKSDMTWEELDGKLREGVENEMEERKGKMVHQALQKALVGVLPEEFEVPDTLIEQVAKERFAMMLSDMREKGATDDDLKEIITVENYERYKKISAGMTQAQVKGDFALKHIAQQQGLVVSRNDVDEEVMALQRASLQRGEKFKESEVRPKIEAQLEKDMVLDWVKERATITYTDPSEASEDDVAAVLGESPEALAARVLAEEAAEKGEPAPAPAPAAKAAEAQEAKPDASISDSSAPDGFEWGKTF